ncbi:MAG: hypothetical protein NT007_07815 [Candidatus Kapabacteria bacterium]|nr:hypothetical protein [Candidatus Kapabacteria bacterium]
MGLLILIFSNSLLLSKSKINKIDINPLNRVNFYLSEEPSSYNTELSTDKKKIILKINNCDIDESAREVHNSGIISDVYSFKKGENIELSLILRDKRGFTTYIHPYSRCLSVDIFAWDKISPEEDSYRSGLLALESELLPVAKNYFQSSVKGGNANAAAVLGILLLKESEFIKAAENLNFAIKAGTTIHDIYAAAAQLAMVAGMKLRSSQFIEFYTYKTSVKSPFIFDLAYDSSASYHRTVVELLNDSNLSKYIKIYRENKDSIRALDSAQKKQQLAMADSLKNLNNQKLSNKTILESLIDYLPDWMLKTIFMVILISLIILIILWSAYKKWKKSLITAEKDFQMQVPQKLGPLSPGNIMNKPAVPAEKAAAAYKSNEKSKDETETTTAILTESIKPKKKAISTSLQQFIKKPALDVKLNDDEQKILTAIESQNNQSNKDNSKLEDVLMSILGKSEVNPQFKSAEVSSDGNNSQNLKTTPKIETALHLAEEQQKVKKEQVARYMNSVPENELEKLKEVANMLGIKKEKVKNAADSDPINMNEETISEIARKFGKSK